MNNPSVYNPGDRLISAVNGNANGNLNGVKNLNLSVRSAVRRWGLTVTLRTFLTLRTLLTLRTFRLNLWTVTVRRTCTVRYMVIILYCRDVKRRDKCPRAGFHSGPLCEFTLRPSRDDWCTYCRNTRLLIVDFLFPIVGPVFCLCFGCSVSLHLLDCSTSQTYQNVAK